MMAREQERLVTGCTDRVLSLPHPPPGNAGARVEQIDHSKPEGMSRGEGFGLVPFKSVPEEQVVLETPSEKLVPRSERQIHLHIARQEEDPVHC